MIQANDIVLFQGDSITDAARNREVAEPNRILGLGMGYCNHLAGRILRSRPADNLKFLNRGMSGDRIVDLYARWRIDAINLQPNVISILVGVNDTWHNFMYNNGVEVDRFEAVYRMLLSYTREQLPGIRFVLCEPFVVEYGVVDSRWIDEIKQRQAVVKKLASEFEARFVPFQSAIDEALTLAPPEYWFKDGVHPTAAGHQLLADQWYDVVEKS